MALQGLASRTRANARGRARLGAFSLIEVMASSVILAVGMASVLSLFSNLTQGYSHQRLQVQALHIAEATMENLLLRYSDDTDLGVGTHFGPGYAMDGNPGGTFFASQWRVSMGVPIVGAREVLVTVTWTEQGVAKSFTLRTVRT